MRKLVLLFILSFSGTIIFAQTSLKEIDLPYGPYAIGYDHYTAVDSTRQYQIANQSTHQMQYRPIPISKWYPADMSRSKKAPLKILNYLEVLKEEEEWPYLPNDFLLDWFPYLHNTPENKKHMEEQVTAFAKAPALATPFPVVIYSPSYQATSIENFALCELLASHGFIVLSSPSRGANNKGMEGATAKDVHTQSRDVEFLLKEAAGLTQANTKAIGLMGYSFGGLANTILAMKNNSIKAVVSLDGTERYRYELLKQSPFFKLERLEVPYIHFAQKDIPEVVLKSDQIPPELNYNFSLYDSLTHNQAYRYKFNDLTHRHFSSFGLLFGPADIRQDKSDQKAMASYRLLAMYTLRFLKGYLYQDQQALATHDSSWTDTSEALLVRKQCKKARETRGFDFRDFHDLAQAQGYSRLSNLYDHVQKAHPSFTIAEHQLNTLGLYLSFQPDAPERGIAIFDFAISLYPNSANLLDSLAEAYLFQKDYAKAQEYFKKSLGLNAQNQNAKKRIQQLRQKGF
ncbi:MAG: dienelactone hydrolase family protein [Dokdonia sp.]|jgi:dienelactone hydrolase